MRVMTRILATCAVVMLAGTTVDAQSSPAINVARSAASAATVAAGDTGNPRQSSTSAARDAGQTSATTDSNSTPAAAAEDFKGTTPEKTTAQQAPEPTGFTYNPEGRRDPFVSLATRGTDTRAGSGSRPPGLAGLGAAEVTLRGTLRSRDGFVAMLQGSDQKTYIVRPGDKLFDGTVSTISQNDLVILQQVNDPLSIEKQREVRKGLRQAEAN